MSELQLLDQQPDLLHPLRRVREARARENQDELLATESARNVAAAQPIAKQPAELAQDTISGVVPERIVEPLQIVQIEHGDAQRRAFASRPMELTGQALFEVAPVEESCQGIPGGLFAQLFSQSEIEQRELDVLAHRHGERFLGARTSLRALRYSDQAQHPERLSLNRQRHAEVTGIRSAMKVTTQQAPLRIQHLVGMPASHCPAVLQSEHRLLRRLSAPAGDCLELTSGAP